MKLKRPCTIHDYRDGKNQAQLKVMKGIIIILLNDSRIGRKDWLDGFSIV